MSFFSPSLPSATATASTATSGSAVPPPALLAVRGGDNEKSRDNTPHFHFIHSMIIPSTTKIQKEMRGRKFKDVQTKLTEAITLFQSFQHEAWPKSNVKANETTDAIKEPAAPAVQVVTEGEDSEKQEQNSNKNKTNRTSTAGSEPVEDDPWTREPMHESVTTAIEAYIMAMQHPQKTNKACEDALECVTQLVIRGYVSGRAGGRDDDTASGSAALRERDTDAPSRSNKGSTSLIHRLLQAIQTCSDSNVESMQSHVVECIKSIMVSPKCGIHEASMLLGIRSVFHIYLVTKSPTNQEASKAVLMKVIDNMLTRTEESPWREDSLWYTDSYYLLRSLVKLSSKSLPGVDDSSNVTPGTFLAQQLFSSSTSVDPLALNNKLLSLELILHSMECAGRSVCNGEKFIHLVQSQLCVALLKNCMSNNTQIAFVSQQIFLILMWKFKAHLKDEIQVFMSNIFLRVLDSDNSSFEQKALVLESLRSLCNDPVLLTQIFLNYDCDFDAMNLYKDIVFQLTKLSGKATAQSTSNMSKKAAEEHYELSLAGNEVLVSILQAFLNALGMQVNNEATNDTAGKKIRKTLNIHEVRTPRRSLRKSSLLDSNSDRKSSAVGEDFEHVTIATAEDIRKKMAGIHTAATKGSSASNTARSDVAGKIVDAFDRKRNAEQNFELGSVKFTLDLKAGINFFIDNGFVECEAKQIAMFFLKNKDKLDKTQMGEVLGREPDAAFIKKPPGLDAEKGGPGFFIRVLHHYISAMDFTGLVFDEAIRLFLSGFRLPGEAQKIDRIMEKFAERFTHQNPDVFPSADTAFILAFSVIMLNTDLHNPSIKEDRRMTLDSFLRNNRGIGDNGSDLPAEFLSGIFERIKARPFSLKEDDAAREKATETVEIQLLGDNGGLLGAGIFGTSAEERRKEKFKKEREEMMSATEQLIRRRKVKASKSDNVTDAVPPSDVVKPMFDVTWGPMIGILSQVIECSNDERSITVCLNGFVYAIRISAHSDMSLARDTFVNSLAKFTYLGSIKEMKYKNIESIHTLMKIAISDGEYLGESWGPVLQCISQLARMRMSASGLDSDESFLRDSKKTEPAGKKKEPSSKSYFTQSTKSDLSKETDDMNSRAILESISEQLIDQVFSSSVKLSAKSLGHFIEQLVAVSDAEIEGDLKRGITGVASSMSGSGHGGDDGPRIFSMQRLVEVADYNMDVRPRLVWAQIWEIMAAFFSRNGCHRNAMVSVFAIDALKQLGLKFLEKPELSEFHFQRLFLRPFLLVTENPETRQDIRELILACIDQMINTRARNLQSGWKILFDVLTISARNPNEKISIHALNILQRTLDQHLDQLTLFTRNESDEIQSNGDEEMTRHDRRVRNTSAEDFLGLCRASLAFIDIKSTENIRPIGVFMRALCHVAIYADLIAARKVLPPVSGAQSTDPEGPGYTYENLDEQEALEMVLWRTLFEGLANVMKATEQCRTGGAGNLVQRGSVLAIRTIILRYGSLFSDAQLKAVLNHTILPAIQIAVENDGSPVISISSDSPAVSSLDFLVEPLPVPPPVDDVGLLKFEEVFRNGERAPSRSMGPAELLLEATFMDLRHGGGGDLIKAHRFAKKLDMESSEHEEQPFPDSWISTTAPVALGTLTDISTEILLPRGSTGVDVWRSTIGDIYEQWCNGRFSSISGSEESIVTVEWIPCEAVMCIACSEVSRFISRLSSLLSKLDPDNARGWANATITFFSEVMAGSLKLEREIMDRLLREKWNAYAASSKKDLVAGDGDSKRRSNGKEPTESTIVDECAGEDTAPTGNVNEDARAGDAEINMNSDDNVRTTSSNDTDRTEVITADRERVQLIRLDFASLRHPIPSADDIPVNEFAKLDSKVNNSQSSVWMKLLPALKIRCIAAHYLQQGLLSLHEDELIRHVDRDAIALLLKTLNLSRELAESGVKSKDLAHAFQEVIFNDFLVEEGEEALLNIAHLNDTQGSAMFFLTQTAGATNAVIRMLNALYDYEKAFDSEETWDRRSYASQYLMEIMEDIFFKFAESEAKEGHRIDPSVWRNTNDSGVKVAMYCTSFASVVVGLLKAMLSFDPSHIERNKAVFFPMVCELVCVQSEEIRKLVRQILVEKFSPMLGIAQDIPSISHIRHSMRSTSTNSSTR